MKKGIALLLAACLLSFPGCSLFRRPELVAEKPVIYLYPEQEQAVEVCLVLRGEMTASYPEYGGGWKVIARPDGSLVNAADGREHGSLFWEGKLDSTPDFSAGFVVPGEQTADFLEVALAELGLTQREAGEFIAHWLPRMQGSAYNLVSFQGENYTGQAELEVEPAPDTVLRVFMAFRPLEQPVEVEPQQLSAPVRSGFTLVEWGGAEYC